MPSSPFILIFAIVANLLFQTAVAIAQPAFDGAGQPQIQAGPRGIPVGANFVWIGDSDTGLASAGANTKIPLLAFRKPGAAPPMITIGFDYTDLFVADSLGLPSDLYEYSFGTSSMRRFNDRWALRTMLGVGFSTDHQNISSDAWRFRGGVFAIYQANPQWQWSFGAIALGRRDLPAVPAFGAIWQPHRNVRGDFILPNPKLSYLLSDDGLRQHWSYVGAGFDGNTWGYEDLSGADDQLTYSDWRVVAGWHSTPTPPPGVPFARGRKYSAEVGYVFARDLEFMDESREVSLDDSWMLRISTRY